jgi:hypothetical protein
MKDTLDQMVYKMQQLKAFQASIRIQNGRTAHSIRTAHLVAKNRARNSLRVEGSAVKADATASVPSRPTASRCFAIAGQVEERGCRFRLNNVVRVYQQDESEQCKEECIFQALGMHFLYFGY